MRQERLFLQNHNDLINRKRWERIVAIFVMLSCLLVVSKAAFSQTQTVVDAAGNKIILRPDKTWEYAPSEPKPAAITHYEKIQGDDKKQIANILDGLGATLAKSEFENEADFLKRIRSVMESTKNERTGKTLSQTVFVYKDAINYDAETKKFSIGLYGIDRAWVYRPQEMSVQLVTRTPRIGWEHKLMFWDLSTFNAEPEVARIIKPDLSVAIYGFPVEHKYTAISFLPSKIVAFNGQTGEVYAITELSVEPFAKKQP